MITCNEILALPVNNLVDNLLLLTGSSSQINTSGFNTLMSHQIRKKSNVIELF